MGEKKDKLLVSEAEVFYADAPKAEFIYKDVCVTYKPFLSFKERIDFVNEVAHGCVSDRVYYPALFDYRVRIEALKAYTNVTVPKGPKKANNLAYGSGLFEELLNYINVAELNGLMEAAKEEIKQLSRVNPLEDLVNHADLVLEKIEKEFSNIDIEQLYKIMDVISASGDKKEMVRRFKNVYIKETAE